MKRLLPILMLVFAFTSTAHAWWNNNWTLRKKITIDTTAAGGAISDPIGTIPVLIRLSDFNFSAAKDDGSDIRFVADDDKTTLPYQMEKYDSLMGEAFVWVNVPNLKPGASTDIYLYYGNTGDTTVAGDASAKPVYDSDTALVYHFAEKAGTAAADASGNGNNAQNAGLADDGAFIGPGLRLDGKTAVTIPATGTLAWANGATMNWSAWIKQAALTANAVIFSRRDGANDFLIGVDNGVPFVDVNGTRSAAGTPIAANSWHHLAVAADGQKIDLYLDGAAYSSVALPLPALNSPSRLGGDAPEANSGTAPFVGEMDELEISKVARGPGYLKFAALEQDGDTAAKVLTVGNDEAPPAGWLSGAFGLFGVILKSVTIDGWVVIGILAIMSLISWYVMITKYFYVNFVQKGNRLFLKQWEKVALDLTALDHQDAEMVKSMGGSASPKVQRLIHRSPLYRIYHIGSQEIGKRVGSGGVLSSRSIQAIRASLDSGYVRENHTLNEGLVFLTISIAGGPFMGLLGTVVGVMITFAAIAATGEVNISAIAPGLAAALVATVAGLLVAIPALLGYNYLVSRMKTVTSDLQVFIDEFVTKMAELYGGASESSSDDVTKPVGVFTPAIAKPSRMIPTPEPEPTTPMSATPVVVPVASRDTRPITPLLARLFNRSAATAATPAAKPTAKPAARPTAKPTAPPTTALASPAAAVAPVAPVSPPMTALASPAPVSVVPAEPVAAPKLATVPEPPPPGLVPGSSVTPASRRTGPIPPPANSKLGPVAPIPSRATTGLSPLSSRPSRATP